MVNRKFTLLLAMLVLIIFAVGSVSAADNVTADIVVPTEDISVDDVSVDEIEELDDVEEQQTVTTHLYNVTHNSDFYSLMNEANIINIKF